MNRSTTISISLTLVSLLVSSVSAEDLLAPTHQNVRYGDDPLQRLDIWLVKSPTPTPLVVYIHGGGWLGGDKNIKPKSSQEKSAKAFLDAGISFASIDYRLSKTMPLPTPVHDAARAIQFIRSMANQWNLSKDRIGLMGGSAGASTSLWLAFHDDLADKNATDPVSRESTRVAAVYSQNGQSSIDPKWITKNIGIQGAKHSMICGAVGESSLDAAMKNYADHQAMYQEFSPINHLDGSDPPYWGRYSLPPTVPAKSPGHGIHHPMFGKKLMEKSKAVGHRGYLNGSKANPYKNENEFLIDVLTSKATKGK